MLCNRTMTILVLMSSYNGEKYIAEQIDSIMNQKINATIKLRIRDDGSTDSTCDIIKAYIKKYPSMIELISGSNIGYNASFFELLRGANGYDFYSISDQDDVWMENKLQVAVDSLAREKMGTPLLYASTSYLVEDDLKPYGTTRKKLREFSLYNTVIQNICPGHTQVMNNELLSIVQTDIQNIDVSKVYVYDSWISNLAMLYGKIVFNNEPYTFYRQHRNNQLGYGQGVVGQINTSTQHANSGDGLKYRKQISHLFETHREKFMTQSAVEEISVFLESKTLLQRIKYAFRGKLFRQRKMETFMFYVAVILKKF